MKKITVEQFRIFQGKEEFDLKPFTILTGKNNSGKSSLIKGFLLLSDFLSQKDQTYLDFNGKFFSKHHLSSFDNTVNNSVQRKEFYLSYQKERAVFKFGFLPSSDTNKPQLSLFEINDQKGQNKLRLKKTNDRFFLSTYLNSLDEVFGTGIQGQWEAMADEAYSIENQIKKLLKEEKEIQDKLWKVPDKSEMIELTAHKERISRKLKLLRKEKKKLMPSKPEEKKIEVFVSDSVRILHSKTIYGMISETLREYSDRSIQYVSRGESENYWKQSINALKNGLAFNIEHVSTSRITQDRVFLNISDNDISKLAKEYNRNSIKKGTKADSFLRKWMSKDYFDIGEDFKFTFLENIATTVEIERDGKWYNLADLGFGSGQLFTLLLSLAFYIENLKNWNKLDFFLSPNNLIFIIEEPESNLHPKLQSMLIDMLDEAIKLTDKSLKFILETHSEYLIRKLQLLIIKGELDNSDAVIHYMNYQNSDKEKVKHITIDKEGILSEGFGEGFTDEADRLSIELHKFRLKNRRN